MKTSKVKNVTGNVTWDSPNGTLYKFEYTMEDGTVLTAQHKTQDGNFNIGDEVEYEVKGSNSYGSWGKVSKPQDKPFVQGGGFAKANTNSDAILYQVCLKGAMDYYNNQDGLLFTPENINDLAYAIALRAKENINKLQS